MLLEYFKLTEGRNLSTLTVVASSSSTTIPILSFLLINMVIQIKQYIHLYFFY